MVQKLRYLFIGFLFLLGCADVSSEPNIEETSPIEDISSDAEAEEDSYLDAVPDEMREISAHENDPDNFDEYPPEPSCHWAKIPHSEKWECLHE